MKITTGAVLLIALMGTLSTPSAQAQSVDMGPDPLAAPSTVTTLSKTNSPVLDNLILSLYSTFNGPALSPYNSRIGGVSQDTGANGNNVQNLGEDYPWYFDTAITAGYHLDDRRWIGIVDQVEYQPVQGQNIYREALYLKIADTKFLHKGSFNSAWDLRLYVPDSTYDFNDYFIFRVRSVQFSTYDVPGTRFTLGSATSIEGAVYSQFDFHYGALADQRLWRMIISPFINYQVFPTLAATLWIDAVTFLQNKNYSPQNQFSDVEPGVSWDVTPTLNLNPYINVFPGAATWATTTINMNISAKFL